MSRTEIIDNMKAEFEAAPKSSAGFVNHKRGRNIAYRAMDELKKLGMSRYDINAAIYEVWKPYDTHFSKIAGDLDFNCTLC